MPGLSDGDYFQNPMPSSGATIDSRWRGTTKRPPVRDPLAVAVGRAIARRRVQRRLSQADLAEAVGRDLTAIARWETGRRLPTTLSLLNVARALGCPVDALLPSREDPGLTGDLT